MSSQLWILHLPAMCNPVAQHTTTNKSRSRQEHARLIGNARETTWVCFINTIITSIDQAIVAVANPSPGASVLVGAQAISKESGPHQPYLSTHSHPYPQGQL